LLCGSAAAALALSFGVPAASAHHIDDDDLTALELLGKNVFFDKQLSTPRGKQSCASCHEPAVGFVLPLSNVNATTVGAPGAQPGQVGTRKAQTNAYASFSPVFQEDPAILPRGLKGGNFWDGRAEGCGALTNDLDCHLGTGRVSETITPDDTGGLYLEFLGPTADQALNPTDRPGVEQNTREKTVCQMVKTAKYKDLYEEAWGEPIDCNQQGDLPAYHISFKRVAVSVAAWQASDDVNSFTSPRDACIRRQPDPFNGIVDADGVFPCDNLEEVEGDPNLGHDIFYGRNDTGRNRPSVGPIPGFLNAGCAICHNGVPEGDPADPAGNGPRQLYADHGFHCIGTPFNSDIPTTEFGDDDGLAGHTEDPGDQGCFKTPTLRNAAKNERGITKAFFHNGYLKSLEQVVHFYNTSQAKQDCADLGLVDATAQEAIANDCWPSGEFAPQVPPFIVGNLGLTPDEEEALVAYIEALADVHTPTKPSTVK
jgi:cytochrome c peroxidase